MAYGVFTSEWEAGEGKVYKPSLLAPLIVLTVLIPFVVWEQSFGGDKLLRSLESIGYQGNSAHLILTLQWLALLLIVAASVFLVYHFYFNKKERVTTLTYQDSFQLFVISSGIYTIYSLLITLAFMSTYRIEQYLYLVNFGLIYLLIGKGTPVFENRGLPVKIGRAHV